MNAAWTFWQQGFHIAGGKASLSTMQSEVFEAFRDIAVQEDKALKAAGALSKRDDDVTALKADMPLVQWMLGFILAFQIATALELSLPH